MSRDAQDGTQVWGAEHIRDRTAELEKPLTGNTPSSPQPTSQAPNASGRITVGDAAKSIKAGDFLKVHQYPCSREGLLTGIGGGSVIGVVRYIVGASIPKAANWAVGAFALTSILSYEYCQAKRRDELVKMKRVVEVYNRKQGEMKQKEEEAKRKKQQRQAEEEAARVAAQKSWYKFW